MNLEPPWTVLKLLDWSRTFFEERGSDSPRLDAELLLAHVLGVDRVQLYMRYDQPLTPAELDDYRALVKRRGHLEPVAYLVGSCGFWTLELKTDRRALVPRADTEVLVEEVIARLPEGATSRIVDIGTGSGAIAIAVARERPGSDVWATDSSKAALDLAAENVAACDVSVDLVLGDLLDGVDGDFDIIVSNPPYIGADDPRLDQGVRAHEPHEALFAGQDGLEVIRRLVPLAATRLRSGGWLLLEVGQGQAPVVLKLLQDGGFENTTSRKDYNGIERVVIGRRH